MTLVPFSIADAKDRVVKENFPLKQEGDDGPQAQGEGAGKCLFGCWCQHLSVKAFEITIWLKMTLFFY